MTTEFIKNPFVVKSPEDIGAEEANRLFVNVLTDLQKVEQPGHIMLNGPRGCGKSMIFRFLQADCQLLSRKCALGDLPYFGILIRIRNTSPNITELRRLADAPVRNMLNEHFITMYCAAAIFKYLSELVPKSATEDTNSELLDYYRAFMELSKRSGWRVTDNEAGAMPRSSDVFAAIHQRCNGWYQDTIAFARALAFESGERPPLRGPLCGYMDFLFPLLCDLKKLALMPRCPIYLLIDDADLLSYTQTRVLNSWIATRTSADVSLKLSTQLGYRTYRTSTGTMIDTPHDYSDINVIDVYTTRRGRYVERVKEIVQKRLKLAGLDIAPEEFFPPYDPQEQRIGQIAEDIRTGKHPLSGKGFRVADDVMRYARPEYFRELSGAAKSTPSYFYSGFEQLVHISSGLIRYFLEPAALMYGEQQAKHPDSTVNRIDPSIQHEMVSRSAEELMTTQFKRVGPEDSEIEEDPQRMSEFQQKKYRLQSLIEVLGGTFRAKLLSDDAERRVFSIAFTDSPDPTLLELFELGVQAGYFHRKTIGNKDGTGRTPLYILTRRLAPYFKLDPSSFAGYLFVTSARLWTAIQTPGATLRSIKREGASVLSVATGQLQLFAEDNTVPL